MVQWSVHWSNGWSNDPMVGPMVQWSNGQSNGWSNGPIVSPMVQWSVQWSNGWSEGPMVGPMVQWSRGRQPQVASPLIAKSQSPLDLVQSRKLVRLSRSSSSNRWATCARSCVKTRLRTTRWLWALRSEAPRLQSCSSTLILSRRCSKDCATEQTWKMQVLHWADCCQRAGGTDH